ncbi:MAG: hypothetical protein EXX96DRAFT_536024 [Benjaminiella poitrasii]|nr:MAG: hypothetical protein EXX96DRAFT_536024 [Benjaminiella poitrasii]
MDYYIMKKRKLSVQEHIYEQDFRYCICKLVLGQKITNQELKTWIFRSSLTYIQYLIHFDPNKLQDLIRTPTNYKHMFNSVIFTDDFVATFLFIREISSATLALDDFIQEEIDQYFVSITVDLGRSYIFTVVIDDTSHTR